MRTVLALSALVLSTLLASPLRAQDDDSLFGDPPAEKAAAPKQPAADEGDDLFGEPAEDGEADDLFGSDKPAATPKAKAAKVAATQLSREEIEKQLIRQNEVIARELSEFIELNKTIAKQAVSNGNRDELMTILREYGPAVIRAKQHWTAVVGNPARYSTWLGSREYRNAWSAFHHSWQQLYRLTDRFAAVDLELADQLSDALAKVSNSLNEYNTLADEWDGQPGNGRFVFSRSDDRLNQIAEDQFREEADADRETADAARDLDQAERDESAPSDVEEAQQDEEMRDDEALEGDEPKPGQPGADETLEEAEAGADEELFPEDKKPADEDELFPSDEDVPSDDESPMEEDEPADEEPADDLFGDPADEETADETPAEEEPADDLFGEGEEESGDDQPMEEESVDEEPADEEPADDLFGDSDEEAQAEEDAADDAEADADSGTSEDDSADDLFGDG